jgi:hypothetical protein
MRRRFQTNVAALGGSLLLTKRTDVAAAFSLRRLTSDYSGALVQVRRSSDSATKDFGADQPGVNWAELSAWLNGADGFVPKGYGQFGGIDFAQTTAASQPKIILASNGLPALLFNGSTSNMATAAFTLNQAWSYSLCFRQVSVNANFAYRFDGLTGDTGAMYYRPTAGSQHDQEMYAGNPLVGDYNASMPTGTRGIVSGCFNGASSLMEVNGASLASFTGSAGTGNPGGLTLGSRGGGLASTFSNQEVQEFIVLNDAQTSPQLKALAAQQAQAWPLR